MSNLNKEHASNEQDINKKSEENILLQYPRLELQIFNPDITGENSDYILITPNSINGNKKNFGERFYFGSKRSVSGNSDSSQSNRNSQNFLNDTSWNDYNFEDQIMASRQFEISYNIEKSKYYILEHKKGTGTFLKIRNRLVVSRDMIISFCSCHMVLQILNDGKIILYIKIFHYIKMIRKKSSK